MEVRENCMTVFLDTCYLKQIERDNLKLALEENEFDYTESF